MVISQRLDSLAAFVLSGRGIRKFGLGGLGRLGRHGGSVSNTIWKMNPLRIWLVGVCSHAFSGTGANDAEQVPRASEQIL